MIGIYKITNKENGKIYIGQSNDCQRRIKEHQYPSRYKNGYPIDVAIYTHGKDAFTYEIIEECSLQDLNERETYWILYYESNTSKGYNCNTGGEQYSVGENNARAILSEQDVIAIRTAYANHERKKEVYQRIAEPKGQTWTAFEGVWQGISWPHIMPEVFTPENKKYYSTGVGCISNAAFTDEEVNEYRHRYVNESAKAIYESIENPPVKFQTFQHILSGNTYRHLPIYLKKLKVWVQPGEEIPKASEARGKKQVTKGVFTDEEVIAFREEYIEKMAKDIYDEHPEIHSLITKESFQGMLTGKTYKHLPVYKKNLQKWIQP